MEAERGAQPDLTTQTDWLEVKRCSCRLSVMNTMFHHSRVFMVFAELSSQFALTKIAVNHFFQWEMLKKEKKIVLLVCSSLSHTLADHGNAREHTSTAVSISISSRNE